MKLSQQLFQRSEAIWEAYLTHPFVEGLSKGTLEKARFSFYLKQDYSYLMQYAKAFALGVVKAEQEAHMRILAQHLHGILNEESQVHINYLNQLAIDPEERKNTRPSKVNLSYTSYMIATAQTGTLAELIAVILPCEWGYAYIGERLNRQQHDHFYSPWIHFYASEGFQQSANQLVQLFDELTVNATAEEAERLHEIFQLSSRYELDFWEMAYHQRMWEPAQYEPIKTI